jgi:hypothetical protein
VPSVDAADLWALPYPPPLLLPINHLENVLRAVWSSHRGEGEAALTTWFVESITFCGSSAASAELVLEYGSGHFTITGHNYLVLMDLKGVALLAHDEETTGDDNPVAPVAATAELVGTLNCSIGK